MPFAFPKPPFPMPKFDPTKGPRPIKKAVQTRDMDVLVEFLTRLQKAFKNWEYQPVEELMDPAISMRTRAGDIVGIDAAIRHLKVIGQTPHDFIIAAPKGGLTTVQFREIVVDTKPRVFEMTVRVQHDKVTEIIDLGRTPEMVYRPLSQPN